MSVDFVGFCEYTDWFELCQALNVFNLFSVIIKIKSILESGRYVVSLWLEVCLSSRVSVELTRGYSTLTVRTQYPGNSA